MFSEFISLFTSGPFAFFIEWLFILSPVWLPLALGAIFFRVWLTYIRSEYLQDIDTVLLEVRIPQEIQRTPKAMEVFFTSLYQTGAATYIDTYWRGKFRPWFSLEIASFGGDIHFYVWTHSKYVNLVEAQLYAQYPTIEVREVEDYTRTVDYDPESTFMWGTYFKLTEPDPYPIKTYIDYGIEDGDPTKETYSDPMSSVLEYLASIQKGEQVWMQILIQAHKKEKFKGGETFRTKPDWKKKAEEEIEKIRKEAVVQPDPDNPNMKFPVMTSGQQESIKAIERSMSKWPFETAIRAFYIAEWESFNNVNITSLIGSFRQYSSSTGNGFSLGHYTDISDNMKDVVDLLPFLKKPMKKYRRHLERVFFKAYKMRSFFHPPFRYYKMNPYILNTEELSTIFHLPSGVTQPPSFKKTEAKKAEPPSNLPL